MTKAKKRKAPERYDWERIRRDYVEGWQNGEGRHLPTLEELAAKYGVPISTMRRQSTEEGWVEAKNVLEIKLVRAREKKAVELLAHYAVTFDRRVLTVAERLVELIARSLAPYEIPEIGPPRPPPDSLIIRRLAAALKNAHEVARRALGETPGVEFEDQTSSHERGRYVMHVIPKQPPGNDDDADE